MYNQNTLNQIMDILDKAQKGDEVFIMWRVPVDISKKVEKLGYKAEKLAYKKVQLNVPFKETSQGKDYLAKKQAEREAGVERKPARPSYFIPVEGYEDSLKTNSMGDKFYLTVTADRSGSNTVTSFFFTEPDMETGELVETQVTLEELRDPNCRFRSLFTPAGLRDTVDRKADADGEVVVFDPYYTSQMSIDINNILEIDGIKFRESYIRRYGYRAEILHEKYESMQKVNAILLKESQRREESRKIRKEREEKRMVESKIEKRIARRINETKRNIARRSHAMNESQKLESDIRARIAKRLEGNK